MSSLLLDLRHSLRFLLRRPLFSVVAVLSLAIGVGVNTALFSAANALLLRAPGGVEEPERVVEVGRTSDGRGFDTFSHPELLDLREGAAGFEGIAGWRQVLLSVSLGREGERTNGMLVSADYFRVLGVRPALGRFFLPEEDRTPETHRVAVVSHRFWRDRMGADPGAVGRTLLVNRHALTVVGVLPEGFTGPSSVLQPDVWLPMMLYSVARPRSPAHFHDRRATWLLIVGRMAPGVTRPQAEASLRATVAGLRERFPDQYRDRDVRVQPFGPIPGALRGGVAAFLGVLLALSGIVLLVTCANLAGILLARALTREREIAIRLAVGAGRGRLVRQLVTEALVLFVLGGAGGLLLAAWAMRLLAAVDLPVPVPMELDLRPDGRVVAFALAVALVAGMASSLLPAWQSTRPDLVPALRSDGRRPGRMRLRQAFVMGQVGLSVLLLVAAGLFLRSLQRAGEIGTGFDPAGVEMVSFDLALDRYDGARGQRFVADLLERVAALPGVTAASAANDLPMDLSANEMPFLPEGWRGEEERGLGSGFNLVAPGYFDVLRIPLLAGRGFREGDDARGPAVAVVSREYARRAWPGEDPLGKRIRVSESQGPGAGLGWLTVVGVAENVKNQMLTEETEPMVYLSLGQAYESQLSLLVRSPGGAQGRALLREIHALDPNLSRSPAQSVEAYAGLGLMPQRLGAGLASALGMLALLLSGIGIYGVVAYAVAQRTREIGIRMALGARRGEILRMILRGVAGMALPGVAVGGGLAFGLSRLIRGFLLGVSPADPLTFGGVGLLLLGVALLAGFYPARQAADTEPMVALRADG